MTGRTVLAVLVLVAVAVVVLALMARSWRTRQAESTAAVPSPPAPPADRGAPRTGVLDGVYVATAVAGEPFVRVPGHGLGARSPARIQVHDAGLTVERTGASDLFVPADRVVAVERTAGMAGKVVGGDRLVVVRWRLGAAAGTVPAGGPVVDTGLHLRDAAAREALTDALRTLVPHPEETT